MHDFTSTPSSKSYLRAELPVYLRAYSRHQGHVCTFSVSQGTDGRWFLTPHASVIAAVRIADPTPVIEIEHGEVVGIDGRAFMLTDEMGRQGYNPFLVAEVA